MTLSSFCFPQNIAEYDLKDISYKVRSPTCHELTVLGSSDEPMVFNFEEEREAQKWWTIVSSSLREVQKGEWGPVAARGLAGIPRLMDPTGRRAWGCPAAEQRGCAIPPAFGSPSAGAAPQPLPSPGC